MNGLFQRAVRLSETSLMPDRYDFIGLGTTLDAISSPGLRNVEARLLVVVPPFPRELLSLLGQVFYEHIRRAGPTGPLELSDVETAIARYQAQRASS